MQFINNYKEILIEYVILFSACMITSKISSFLMFAITLDGIFSATSFLRTHYANNLTQSQTLLRVGSLYSLGTIDRYIYYCIVFTVYQYLCLILWIPTTYCVYLYYFCSLLLSPTVINLFIYPLFSEYISNRRYNLVQTLSKYLSAYFLAGIINFISLVTVDLRPNIHYSELLPLVKTSTISNFPKILLNFLLATLVQYTHNNGKTLYSRLIKTVYTYNTGKKIHSIKSEEQAKEKIVNVIVTRRWKDLITPETLQTFFLLYQSKEDSIIYTFFTECEYRVLIIGSLYTITKTICRLPAYFIALFSLVLSIYRSSRNVKDHQNQIDSPEISWHYQTVAKILPFIVGLVYPEQYLLNGILSETLYYLLIQIDLDQLSELNHTLSVLTNNILLQLYDYKVRYIIGSNLLYLYTGIGTSAGAGIVGHQSYKSYYLLFIVLLLVPHISMFPILILNYLLYHLSSFNPIQILMGILHTLIYHNYHYLLNLSYIYDKSSYILFKQETPITQGLATIDILNSYHPNITTTATSSTIPTSSPPAITNTVFTTVKVPTDVTDITDIADSQVISDAASTHLLKHLPYGNSSALDKSYYLDENEEEGSIRDDILHEYQQ